jgi:hypothetical protein
MQGWFPWFASVERKAKTAASRAHYLREKNIVDSIVGQQQLAEREANKELGLFSKYGIDAAKSDFWCGTARHVNKGTILTVSLDLMFAIQTF